MWGMLKYLILLMYKYIMWHMFKISISAYSDNYSYKKMINNFHYVFFFKNYIYSGGNKFHYIEKPYNFNYLILK